VLTSERIDKFLYEKETHRTTKQTKKEASDVHKHSKRAKIKTKRKYKERCRHLAGHRCRHGEKMNVYECRRL